MPLPKIEEIRDLSDQELNDRIVETKKELFQLRFQKATRQLDKPHQFKHLRHRLAQLMTVERERQLAAANAASDSSAAEE
ncbi:MAG: 50S ribosomal protein L29 [Synechococcales cyanobacterium C42_A2020_086]|jgi:large subunit ribosomal protein L29|nr:50S ribosomal protein L29 [Synechococcales cyanobacterium M58_A2018_015]MBF2074332.1 50S ribosomal protein L29 [Synechococcales cyanobacterium C42_A2020_086]